MMYRPPKEQKNRKWLLYLCSARRHSVELCCILLLLVGISSFRFLGNSNNDLSAVAANATKSVEKVVKIKRTRILRTAIPPLNIQTLNYSRQFDDLNDIQLEAAMLNGVKQPELLENLEDCPELVAINDSKLFRIDSMTYSKPYLIPEAALLLNYIGERFQEIYDEHYPNSNEHYRLIVTSALRSQQDVERLRRHNRNATENSCHRYGTTFDISYIRFENNNGVDINELFLKNLLSQTLYELRYEGLCYVKYERGQSCFHITVRNTEYKGDLASVTEKRSDFYGIHLDNWGDDGSLVATEALTKEYREHGTIHGKPVGNVVKKSSRSKSSHHSSKSKKSSTPKTSHSTSSQPKYRAVPAPGQSGEEGIMAW